MYFENNYIVLKLANNILWVYDVKWENHLYCLHICPKCMQYTHPPSTHTQSPTLPSVFFISTPPCVWFINEYPHWLQFPAFEDKVNPFYWVLLYFFNVVKALLSNTAVHYLYLADLDDRCHLTKHRGSYLQVMTAVQDINATITQTHAFCVWGHVFRFYLGPDRLGCVKCMLQF